MDALAEFVWVEPSEKLNGALKFQSTNPHFLESSKGLLDDYHALDDWTELHELERVVTEAGIGFKFLGGARERYELIHRVVDAPFTCSSPWLKEHELWPEQRIGLNLALAPEVIHILWQWGTGCGKTIGATLLAQKLFDEGLIDLAMVFCERVKKVSWERYFQHYSNLSVFRIGDQARALRHRLYEEIDDQVLIFNYEKARAGKVVKKQGKKEYDYSRTDMPQLFQIIDGKRVLWLFDEAQIYGNKSTYTHRGLSKLLRFNERSGGVNRRVALTATPDTRDPDNIHDIFTITVPKLLPTKEEYREELVDEWGWDWSGKRRYPKTWHIEKLPLLRRRIELHMSVISKSKPSIAARFPAMTEIEVELELSDSDREIYALAQKFSREMFQQQTYAENRGDFQVMRMICNTTESLIYSPARLAKKIVDKVGPDRLKTEHSEKFQSTASRMEKFFSGGEKVVLFTYFLTTLFPYRELYRKRWQKDIPIWTLKGGMSEEEMQRVQDRFNDCDGPALFFSNDAGKQGIDLYAPNLSHIELPYLYSWYMQRRDRVHRGDSLDRGIPHCLIDRYLTIGTVEERTNEKVMGPRGRRRQHELFSGQKDVDAKQEKLSGADLEYLMFGEAA